MGFTLHMWLQGRQRPSLMVLSTTRLNHLKFNTTSQTESTTYNELSMQPERQQYLQQYNTTNVGDSYIKRRVHIDEACLYTVKIRHKNHVVTCCKTDSINVC